MRAILLAAILLLGLAPAAEADHCHSRVSVYSRQSVLPPAPPPALNSTASACLRVFDEEVGSPHKITPRAEWVFVRFQEDLGWTTPTLTVALHGLGFTGETYTLEWTPEPFGGAHYAMQGYALIPDGADASGWITATVELPGGELRASTYTTWDVN